MRNYDIRIFGHISDGAGARPLPLSATRVAVSNAAIAARPRVANSDARTAIAAVVAATERIPEAFRVLVATLHVGTKTNFSTSISIFASGRFFLEFV